MESSDDPEDGESLPSMEDSKEGEDLEAGITMEDKPQPTRERNYVEDYLP